jgi:hypothetical protein
MITVYFLETQYNYMGWNDVFLELVLKLRDKFNANIVHQKGGRLRIEKFDYDMPDCELMIHDETNDTLRSITWSEGPTKIFDVYKNRNNKNDILLLTQQAYWFPKDYDYSVHNFTVKPTTFYTFTPQTNHNHFYNLRRFKKFEQLIDQLFFLASTRREDPFALRDMGLCSPSPGALTIDQYLTLATDYKVGLSISSTAEMCYRDIEYMAIGLPMLRLEYMTVLNPPLIPNYHYISIPRDGFDWSPTSDRAGGPAYIEAYKKRFFEVKDDKEFLEFIANNAREYYLKYCSPENKLSHVMTLLELPI